MAVPALGYGTLTLAIASEAAVWSSQAGQLWRAVMFWGLGLRMHRVVWEQSAVESAF